MLKVLDSKELRAQIIELDKELTILNNNLKKLLTAEINTLEHEQTGKYSQDAIDSRLVKINNDRNYNEKRKLEIEIKRAELEDNIDNLQNIDKLKKRYSGGKKLSIDIIDKIISKIVITKQEDEFWKSILAFNVKQIKGDKCVELKFSVGQEDLKFYISQRTDEVMMYIEDIGSYLRLNDFISKKYPKSGLRFVMGR